MEASIASMGWNVNISAKISISTEDAAIAYRDETNRCAPKNFHPSRNRGMLSTITTTPMGREGMQ
jgi:hypothetical protein